MLFAPTPDAAAHGSGRKAALWPGAILALPPDQRRIVLFFEAPIALAEELALKCSTKEAGKSMTSRLIDYRRTRENAGSNWNWDRSEFSHAQVDCVVQHFLAEGPLGGVLLTGRRAVVTLEVLHSLQRFCVHAVS